MADPDEPIPTDGEDGTPEPVPDDVEPRAEEEEKLVTFTTGLLQTLGLPSGQDFAGSVDRAVAHAVAAPAAAAPGWAAIGPRNITGAIRALIQDPRDPLVFYAGSASGGAWKTVDGGLSWRPIGDAQHLLSVGSLALAPGDSRILLVGTGEPFGPAASVAALGGQGLFISTDRGEHLTRLAAAATGAGGPGSADHYTKIVVDPAVAVVNGAGLVTTAGTAVIGAGTTFTTFLKVGDLLKIGDELRVVTAIANNTALTIDRALPVDAAVATAYARATRRFWAAGETGLWRFEPSVGFVLEGPMGAVPAGNPCSDVVVVQDPANAGRAILYVGMQAAALFRGVFTRAGAGMAWTLCNLPRQGGGNVAAGQMGRIRIAISAAAPFQVYVIMENQGAIAGPVSHPTHIYHSAFATAFARRSRPYNPATANETAMSDYALALAVHPTTPNTIIFGSQTLRISTDGGNHWDRIMDGARFDAGDRAQHSDHHAVVFDAGNPARVWVANDAGISITNATTTVAPFAGWRRRSFGLVATQFHDVSVNATLPFITAGGLRDMTTYMSYGGLTWYQVGVADGGPLVFTNDPRNFFTSSQAEVNRSRVGIAATPAGSVVVRSDLVDVRPIAHMRVVVQTMTAGKIPAVNSAPFVAVVEGHPTSNNHFIVGRHRRAFRTTNGTAFAALQPNRPAGETVSAISFIPGQPSNQFWIGTTVGNVFRTGTAAAINPPWAVGTPPVHRIAIVSAGGANLRVAVCSAGLNGEVFVADLANPGAAVNWVSLTAGLPPGPFTSVVFDPNNISHLYVGTFAGVYGAQNLPAFPIAAPAAVAWQTFNAGLPLAVVHDLAVCPVTQTLRCATYGRGMFERSLATAPPPPIAQVPPALLLIRNHVMDDGRIYPAVNTLATDPRQAAAAATAAIDNVHSVDIRVDAPRFRAFETIAFGEPIDGAEFDESLVHDDPILGDNNIVYVQVQNRGHTTVQNVDVHLYFAAMPAAPAVPNLQAGFRAAFPGDPPAGAWQRVGPPITIGEIGAGAPAVVTFDWEPPIDLGANAALLAVCTSAADALNLGSPVLTDAVATLALAERRAAVRVMATVANPIYVRDAVDDDGTPGAVAWGGRSPDIVVLPAAPPADVNARPEFSDLDDPRLTDRVRGGNANHVIVRVHNRLGVQVTADVDLYRVRLATLTQPAAWVRLNAANAMRANNIPARGWRFTAAVQWNVPDADTTFILVAIVGLPGAAPAVPKPDHTTDVTSVDALWRFLKSSPLADKVAMRCLRRA